MAIPSGSSAKYIPRVRSVFRRFYDLPVNINSVSLGVKSPMVEAVEMLLALPFGSFRRSEFLALLVHPNVRSRFRDIDADTWVRWARELHIIHGASKKDHYEKTYIERDLFNWTQGLRRLVLGSFLSAPDTGDEARWRVTIGDDDYRPEDVDEGEVDTAACLYALAQSLISDAEWLRSKTASLEEWAQIFGRIVDAYIHPSDAEDADYGKQLAAKSAIKTVLGKLAELCGESDRISYRTAYLLALESLERLVSGTHHRLVGGVVVSTPAHLRNLPFEHIFVLGLGEGKYPALDPENVLDLRRAKRQRGDILPSERDKFHFLELLLSARRGIHLSWVARESTTGNELPPSSLISDLKRMLGVVPDTDGGDCLTGVYPLRRYNRLDDELGPNLHPEAFEEARMHALRERIEREVGEWEVNSFRRFLDGQDSSLAGKLRWQTRLSKSPEPSHEDKTPATPREVEHRRIRLNYSKLVSYLKTPFQTAAKTKYGIYDDEDDVFAAMHEPFSTSHLQDAIVPRDVFLEVCACCDSAEEFWQRLEEVYESHVEQEILKGAWPTEIFSEPVRSKHMGLLELWKESLRIQGPNNINMQLGQLPELVSFGVNEERYRDLGEVRLEFEASETGGEKVEVLLYGKAHPLNPAGTHLFAPAKHGPYKTLKRFRSSLGLYLDHIMLSAAAKNYAGCQRTGFLLTTKKKPPKSTSAVSFPFPALGQEVAKSWLKARVKELLFDSNEYLLPHEVVWEYIDNFSGGKPVDFQAIFAELRNGWSRMYVAYGPIRDYEAYPLHPDAEALIAERFGYHPAYPREEA